MSMDYMRSSEVGNGVVPSALHAGQFHDMVNDTVGLRCHHGDMVPGRGYTLPAMSSKLVDGHWSL